jgi:DNA repair exonuclease SbcCD nuclease subunit
MAKSLNVDFVLLGGDLFHDNKPSRSTLIKTIRILKQYCFDSKPIQFQILSDQSSNFCEGCACLRQPHIPAHILTHPAHQQPSANHIAAAHPCPAKCTNIPCAAHTITTPSQSTAPSCTQCPHASRQHMTRPPRSVVNYEDPNLNVGTPVFTIHGNHDDASGTDNSSAVDILSSCGLVNYFGKVVSSALTARVDRVNIAP